VLKDPRANATLADLTEQYDLLLRIRDRTNEANAAVRTIRSIKEQIAERKTRAGSRGAALNRVSGTFVTQLSAVEEEIYQVRNQSGQDPLNYPIKLNNQIAALSGVVASAEAKPTRQSLEVFELLSGLLDAELRRLNALLGAPLSGVNAELTKLNLPVIVPRPAAPPIADD
jgi:hypothetical protein